VIVEASGVANPMKIAPYGQTPGFTLDGVIVVADAETVQKKARDKYVGRTVVQQLKSADLVLLNKTDLITEEQKQEVRDWLAQTAPKCRIVEAQYGVVPPLLLLGAAPGMASVDLAIDSHDHATDDVYQSWSYVGKKPLTRLQIERFVAGLPESVLRVKGVLYLEDEADRQTIFQLVGRRWSLTPGEAWGSNKPESHLIAIGIQDQFDPSELTKHLEEYSCRPPIIETGPTSIGHTKTSER
jgi:G3E family GTPase